MDDFSNIESEGKKRFYMQAGIRRNVVKIPVSAL